MKNPPPPVYRLKANPGGETLLDLLVRNSLSVPTDCNGHGICGKCRVRLLQGEALPLSAEEMDCLDEDEQGAGVRLACLCRVTGEIEASIPESKTVMQIEEQGQACDFKLDPVISKQHAVLSPEKHESLYGCLIRQIGIPAENRLGIAQALAEEGASGLTAVRFNDTLIGIEPGDTCHRNFGVAVDIGTTTIAAALVDLNAGETLSTASAINPQFQLGSDVLSRIHYAQQSPVHLDRLESLLRNEINALIRTLYEATGVEQQYCYMVSIAANTVMLHLFLGADPKGLGAQPYQPVFLETLELKAADLGIQAAPFAVLQCLPGLSAFVGADIQAGLLALNLTDHRDNVLFIDMGTNGEIVIFSGDRIIATSTAAGPAFEGMNISCGMKACPGAIDHVDFSAGRLTWSVVGDEPPAGLCGSGLLELTAALLKKGVIQKSGRIIDPETAPSAGVLQEGSSRRFQLVKPSASNGKGISLTQQDVRQVQLAKGSLGAGMKLLLKEAGLSEHDIKTIYLAGGFGRHLKPETFIYLGLFPPVWQDRIVYVGNTSLTGAGLSMLSSEQMDRHREKIKNVEFYDLTACNDFNRVFAGEMHFHSHR